MTNQDQDQDTVPVGKLKDGLCAVLRRVEQGRQVVITKHGRAVAVITPADQVQAPGDGADIVERILRFAKGRNSGHASIRQAIVEGRR